MNISMSLNLKGTKENTTKKGGGRLAKKKKKFSGAWLYVLLHIQSTFYNKTSGGGKSFILNDSS